MKTFKDVKRYIENAERDDVGMHEVEGTIISSLYMHIYEGRYEFNTIIRDNINYTEKFVGKLYFSDDEVVLVPISNQGVSLFEDSTRINVNTAIDDKLFSTLVSTYGVENACIMQSLLFCITK